MKKAIIIIVNWNGKKFLKNCLNSIYKQTYKKFEVYFIDNGSIDKSPEYVRKNFPTVKIIQLDRNYGFAKGNNEGIKEAFKDKQVEYIICLNNDTEVDKNWLKELIKTAEKDEKIGAVGSLSIYPNKKIQTAGIKLLDSKTFNENRSYEMSLFNGESQKSLKREIEIFAPSGVSALYKKKSLEKVGLFDEDFFAYCEDIDLGYRLRNKGYISICNPKSKLTHFHSQTGKASSPFKAFYSKRNSFFVVIKNFSFIYMLLYPLRDLMWNLTNLYKKDRSESINKLSSKIGSLGIFAIMLKVYLSILYYLPKMLMKRYSDKKA
jgi:GT2 family glycosyltransferase